MSGCVFKQNETIDTQMKNTDITPIIYNYAVGAQHDEKRESENEKMEGIFNHR